jgi:hypothetical protein
MTEKYNEMLEFARKEKIFHYYDKILREMIADDFNDFDYVKSIVSEGLKYTVTKDQMKLTKERIKNLFTDKSHLKEINAILKN